MTALETANAQRTRLVLLCEDCTGQDPMGCWDGEPWVEGVFDSYEEAEAKGWEITNDCAPWYFRLERVEDDR